MTRRDPLPDELVRRGLRFPQLRLMVALQETGRISDAAAQLAMSQPAASRLLAELERTLNATLYERHPRGVTLTEAGTLFAARARAALLQMNDAGRELDQMAAGARGFVRIGSVTGPGLEIVLPVIRELRVTYPEIEMSVQIDTSDKLAEAMLSHKLDFYIGRLPDGVHPQAVTLLPVGEEPVSLIVRAGHPLERRNPLTLEECLTHDWVLQAPGGLLRLTAERYLLDRGLRMPGRILSTSSLLLTLALISETNAIAPISSSVARFYAGLPGSAAGGPGLGGHIAILPVAQDMTVSTFSLIRPADTEPTPATQRVLGLVEAKIARTLARGAMP